VWTCLWECAAGGEMAPRDGFGGKSVGIRRGERSGGELIESGLDGWLGM